MEAQVLKEPGGLGLGIDKQVEVSALELDLHQVGDELVQQPLPLVFPADGKAAQRVSKAASGGNHTAVAVVHGADIVQVGVPADALLLQQAVDLRLRAPVGGRDLGNGIHRDASILIISKSLRKGAQAARQSESPLERSISP